MADEPHPLAIPEFLRVAPGDRKAAWDKHRTPVPATQDDWRKERNKTYAEAVRKDSSSGDPGKS